ncbi:MAG TPA: RidA family protein [Vicinamibacteria bacterium]|nr:RidA family protein [Vicinamibacteria bacterium]
MNRVRPVDPEGLPRPSHHSHGAVGFGDWLFVSAQTGRTREGRMASGDVAEQLAQALDNVLDVVWAAGGSATSLARVAVYVRDGRGYRLRRRAIDEAWRRRLGDHRPALTVFEVAGLLDDEAQVAVEAVALV